MRHACAIALAVAALAAIVVPAAARPSPRIVGGQAADIAAMPWLTYLQVDNGVDAWSCGGTIVAPHYVLTAAHCVLENGATIDPKRMAGVAGRANLKTEDGTRFGVTRIAVHPQYDRTDGIDGGPYDAALLWIDADLPYTPLPIATVADAAAYAPGISATIAGWGTTTGTGTMTDVLMTAFVPIVSDEQCAKQDGVTLAEARTMLCAGFDAGGVDSCAGDSGGPLTVLSPNGAILAGIVSWGYECAAPNRPGLYTRAATLTDWLQPLLAGDPAVWGVTVDRAAPKVRVRAVRVGENRVVRFRYRISGEQGKTRETITIVRKRGGTVLRRLPTKLALNPPGEDTVVRWRLPRSFTGAYLWCVRSTDAAGNPSTLECARLTAPTAVVP